MTPIRFHPVRVTADDIADIAQRVKEIRRRADAEAAQLLQRLTSRADKPELLAVAKALYRLDVMLARKEAA